MTTTNFAAVDGARLDQSIANVCTDLDRVRAQRDELLAALKDVLGKSELPACVERERAVAAIAHADGEARR